MCNVKSEKPNKLYRVHWQIRTTGKRGFGNPLDKTTAEAWVKMGNEAHPLVDHWIELEEKQAT